MTSDGPRQRDADLDRLDDPERSEEAQRAEGPQPQRREEFVLLFAKHQPAIFGYLLSLLPNWADAEEALQQTSLVLWRKFDDFESGTNFPAWACRIARFKALTILRSQSRDRRLFSEHTLDMLADEGVEDLERLEAERRALASCLGKLPAEDGALVRRCHAPGVHVRQIAETLGRTPNSLYKWLNRVRDVLQRCVEQRLSAEGWT